MDRLEGLGGSGGLGESKLQLDAIHRQHHQQL